MRNLSIAILAVFLVANVGGATARAEEANYPTRRVEIVVPFPAGGATDVIARLAAQMVAQGTHQPMIVDNKTGATGAIGSEFVAHADPDGYTLLIATASTAAVLPAYRKLPYDTVSSFAPATLLATFPNMLVVNPEKVPAKTVAELIALLKSRPGKFSFSSSGTGGSVHFAGELFKYMTKTDMVHVPYRGSAPALNDLLAGNVDLTFDNMTTVWPMVQQGRVRALGLASLERTPLAPDIPAIAETVPGYEALSWVGVVAPAGTPPDIVARISSLFGEAMQTPEVQSRLKELGGTPTTDTPDQFKTFMTNDRAKWQKLADEAHLHESE
jgi:tripartite-type tricarboxylate transporter receptor subunit TctC